MSQASQHLHLGHDDQFREYIEIFGSAGTEISKIDVIRAFGVWNGLPMETRVAALEHALELCLHTKTRFIPKPVNHLLDEGWTRVAMPRTLPYIDPKEREAEDALHEFERQAGLVA